MQTATGPSGYQYIFKNINAAKEVGWRTVLVGLTDRDTGARIECPAADAHVASLRDLRTAVPELFS